MARRAWLIGLVVIMLWLVGQGVTTWPTNAGPLPQIVQPGDVATPTATFTIILVPTPTATPVPTAAQAIPGGSLDEASAEIVVDAGVVHGVESFSTYVVQPGDTLLTVALEIGVDVPGCLARLRRTFK